MRTPASRPPRSWATLLIALVIAGCSAGTTGAVPPSDAADVGVATVPPTARPSANVSPSPTPPADPLEGGEPLASPSPVATATPSTAALTPGPTAAAATPPPEPFALSLYHRGDYVPQYTFEWCVGASLQMALRIVDRTDDTSKTYQQELWEMARDRSFSPFGGANPRGWTAALNDLGIGPYRLVSLPTLDEAVRVAAEALRTTERPVGLVMWRGRHAWVMSGFESVGDPAIHDDFRVTGVRVLDPLHPHGSSVWGSSPAPNSLLSLETLGKQFVLRDSRRVNLGVPPGYLLVLPVVEAAA